MVKVLKKLQSMGGSIIVHGYTHAYRYSETGEGFEFWDAKADQPITSEMPKTPVHFGERTGLPERTSLSQLSRTISGKGRNVYKTKLTRAIEDLTSSGLYPLAFEAPHYTMSDYGYQISLAVFYKHFRPGPAQQHNMENIRCTSVCDCSFDVARNDALSGNDRLCRHIEAKPVR